MKGVGRTVFYINCLYGLEMRGEEDTEGGMAAAPEDVWDGYRTSDRKQVYELQPARRAAAC